jgi:hypothetical protein
MHTVWELIHRYWIALGLGALLGDWIKRLGEPVIEFLVERYDRPVWNAIKVPRYHVAAPQLLVSGGYVPPRRPKPYAVGEITDSVHRKQFLVLMSLRRLEKRGKVKETHEGWMAV